MRDTKTNEICALKSFNMEHDEKEGFALTSIREIKILKALDVDKSDNNHIVRMKEVVYGEDEGGKVGMKFYMVMEYLDHDLSGLVSRIKLEEKHVKTYLNQLLKGIRFLHLNKILHRDIKVRREKEKQSFHMNIKFCYCFKLLEKIKLPPAIKPSY